jgi:hypothetical protein
LRLVSRRTIPKKPLHRGQLRARYLAIFSELAGRLVAPGFVTILSEGIALRHHHCLRTTSEAFLSSLRLTNLECRRCPSGVHSANSICATSSGLSQRQFFISSLVRAHMVRFFSRRLANGQSDISNVLNRRGISLRTWGTKPFRTLAT